MKKKIALLLLTISSLQAALPPFAQSSKEVKAILADPRLYQTLGGAHVISEIQRVEGGYVVFTAANKVLVKVNYLPSQMPGPARFELEFPAEAEK